MYLFIWLEGQQTEDPNNIYKRHTFSAGATERGRHKKLCVFGNNCFNLYPSHVNRKDA